MKYTDEEIEVTREAIEKLLKNPSQMDLEDQIKMLQVGDML